MSQIDGDLLFLYAENARIKLKDLSSKLKKSSPRLKYTLRQLAKEGIVQYPHCVFDYSYFGQILFKVYFKGGYISEKEKAVHLQKLKENPYVVSIYELNGEFDLAIEMESPNPSRFNKELKKISDLIPTLTNYKIILNIVTHRYPRTYLVKDPDLLNEFSPEVIIGGDRHEETFTPAERKVIKALLWQPVARLTTLAKEADLNVKTLKSIWKSLQRRKIIKGFKYTLNTEKLDLTKYRLFLKLHNLTSEREGQLLEFFQQAKEVAQVHKTVGDWNLEVDMESPTHQRLRYLIVQLRENFKDLIETFNLIEFYQYYKKSTLPRYLFEETEEELPPRRPTKTI